MGLESEGHAERKAKKKRGKEREGKMEREAFLKLLN